MEHTSPLLWFIILCSLKTTLAEDRFENITITKPVNTSKLVNRAQRVVDNNANSCAYFSSDGWWLAINLGRPYPVHTIALKGEGLKDCVISVEEIECYKFSNQSNDDYEITFNCSNGVLNGGVINVTTCGDDAKICDFKVLSCRDPYWGSDCSNDCGQCNGSEVCDKVTGHCISCPPGLQPPMCNQNCTEGYHGQNCTQRCSENCVSDSCDPLTGNCHCNPGFQETDCTKGCSPGKYGQNCTQPCSKDCVNGSCDPVTGMCPCKSGVDEHNCIKVTTMGKSPQPKLDMKMSLSEPMMDEEESVNVGVIAGAAAGAAVVLVILVAIIIIIIRRKRSTKGSPKVIYETYNDAIESRQQANSQNQLGNAQGTRSVNESHLAPESSLSSKSSHYINVDVSKGVVSSPAFNEEKPQAKGQLNSSTSRQWLEEEVEEEVEDVEELEAEVEKDDHAAARDFVYYNDDVYMTSAGTSLRMDRVQKYLLENLRGSDIDLEFDKKLPRGMVKSHETGLKDENYYKNRFTTILPYEDTRVILRGVLGAKSNDYINANYIKGARSPKEYIATQGPKVNTLTDFWKMVLQDQVTHIVMLTNIKEGNKKKCSVYWPSPGKTLKFGSVDVTGLDVRVRTDYVKRSFRLKSGEATLHVTQYHYTTWPDHDVPRTIDLVDFWRTVNTSHRSQQISSPLLVHCSAGVGRTGTFIALDILMERVKQKRDINVFQVVQSMRNDRCDMIQTKWQYRSLHEAVLEAYTSQNCRMPLESFAFIFRHAVDPNHAHDRTETEFQKLKQMKVLLQKPRHTEAESEENINKNRHLNVLPDDNFLVHLTLPVPGRNNYVNAVRLPIFGEEKRCILTQLPLPDTMVDLWRLVVGNDVSLIVSFGGETVDPKTKSCYWPKTEGQSLTFGPLIVGLTSTAVLGEHLKQYSLSITCTDTPIKKGIRLLHYSHWQEELPGSVKDLVQLLNIVLSATLPSGNGGSPLLLQCSDGAKKCGLFHACCNIIRRMTSDREIDVYTEVRKIHIIRPECITSKVQYRYIYLVVQEYKKKNEIYSND